MNFSVFFIIIIVRFDVYSLEEGSQHDKDGIDKAVNKGIIIIYMLAHNIMLYRLNVVCYCIECF